MPVIVDPHLFIIKVVKSLTSGKMESCETTAVSDGEKDIKSQPCKRPKKKKVQTESGVIYLSKIPTGMNVRILRDTLSDFGEVGNIFLQADERQTYKKRRVYKEGWVEFTNKRVAKRLARMLNNQEIQSKRRYPWHQEIWNMKYLAKFRWTHLNERLAYEREVHKQRMRTEISQVKKETQHYIQNVERRKVQKQLGKRGKELNSIKKDWNFRQQETEQEILAKKRSHSESNISGKKAKRQKVQGTSGFKVKSDDEKKISKNDSFLKSLFSGGVKDSSV